MRVAASRRRILWSGGFDSTTLVVDALLEGAHVEPVYVLQDPDWQKQRRETTARARIRAALPADLAARLAPDLVVTPADWRGRFLELERGLLDEKRSRAEVVLERLQLPDWLSAGVVYSGQVPGLAAVGELEAGLEAAYVAGDKALGDQLERDLLERTLRLPLATVSKRALLEHAETRGFRELLDLTWSCEAENGVAAPCGACQPCQARIIPAAVVQL